jgi:UrcA family protein
MYSNHSSADQGGRSHSRFNRGWAKRTARRVSTAVRAYTIRVAWVTLASAGGSMLVDAAQASDAFDTTPHKVVSFKDLNLNNPEGVAVLYKRIKSAAYDVCGGPDRYDLSQFKVEICARDAMSRAIVQVNNPMLTSLHESKTGKTGKTDKKETTLAQAH